MNWAVSLLAGFLSGTAGAMGMGGGGVLLIYLTVFAGVSQLSAQGINLIFFLPCALLAIIIYARKKLIKWKIVIPSALCGFLGALLGSYLADIIGGDYLSKIFAVALILLGARELLSKTPPEENTK